MIVLRLYSSQHCDAGSTPIILELNVSFWESEILWVSRVQAVEKQFLARVAATGNSQVHWMLNPRTSCTKTLAFPWRSAMRCHGSERCAQRRASYGLPLTALGDAIFGTSIGYCRFGSLRPPNPIRLGATLWIGRLQQGSLDVKPAFLRGSMLDFRRPSLMHAFNSLCFLVKMAFWRCPI